jgi:uncharacterized protein (TIGR03435 family)
MRSELLALAASLVRAWTRVYTHGLPQAERTARLAEIDSDLWEFEHDPEAPRGKWAAAQVVARLLIGIPDDLAWRMAVGEDAHRSSVTALAAAGVVTGPRRISAFGLAASIHVVAISAVMWLASSSPVPSPKPGQGARGRAWIEHRVPPDPSRSNQRVRRVRNAESVTKTPVQSVATSGKARAFDVVSAVAVAVAVRMGLITPPRPAAQDPSSNGPVFEVASIKPNPAGRDAPTRQRIQQGGRFVAENIPVALLIGQAYDVQAYRLTGGPQWIWSDAFDINAKADRELLPAGGQRPLRGALRGLLADRFKLVAHIETRQLPMYALVLTRNDGRLGPNLTRSSRTDCDAIRAQVAKEQATEGPGGPPPPSSGGLAPPCGAMNGVGTFAIDGGPLERLANHLSAELNVMVADRTGLTGLFNARLTWTPDQPPPSPLEPGVPPIDPYGPSIFTAVQEQLGLKLQKTTGPVDVLVIDRVERPTPN